MIRRRHWILPSLVIVLVSCSAQPSSDEFPDAGDGDSADAGPGGQMPFDSGTMDFDAGLSDGGGSHPVIFDAGPTFEDAGQPVVDAGTLPPVDGGSDLGDTVPNTAAICTSGVYWLLGNVGTDVMNPGQACMACHATNNGPTFTAAGTVYPTAHEPNNCDGSTSGWTITITDAAGTQTQLTPNLAGSFHTTNPIVFPYTVQISGGGYTREMVTPQSTGDCNSCHTQDGANGAPGRIVAP